MLTLENPERAIEPPGLVNEGKPLESSVGISPRSQREFLSVLCVLRFASKAISRVFESSPSAQSSPPVAPGPRASVESGLVRHKGMPDQTPTPPPTTPPPPAPPSGPTINIGEEYGTAKKNLPPAKIVLIAIAGVLVVVLIASVVKRAKPQGGGSLDNVVAVEIPGQNSTLAALTFTLQNNSDKALYVRELQGSVKTASGDSTGDAVSAVDFDRFFQAFPALKNGAQPALAPEVRLEVGQSVSRTIIVPFSMTLDAFNQRKSVSAIIWAYNQTEPLTLTK